MNGYKTYDDLLENIKGKTIGIVYIFEGEDASGLGHYHVWKSRIISGWLNAIQDLNCLPYIMDVRTFVQKASNNTLPPMDYIINLNCGSYELSSMSLVPSTCSFLSIPCIPCDAMTIVTGENKNISNLIAVAKGMNVPKELTADDKNGIFRPLNMGSSIGVKRGNHQTERNGIYQEFILGYDITTPIVYNPLNDSMELLPTIIYVPEQNSLEWFFDAEAKSTQNGYTRKILPKISDELKMAYLEFIRAFSITTFCRIDARIKCSDQVQLTTLFERPLFPDDVFFIEINAMPTVSANNSFSFSYKSIAENDSIYDCTRIHKQLTNSDILNSFLVAASIGAFTRAMC